MDLRSLGITYDYMENYTSKQKNRYILTPEILKNDTGKEIL